MQHLLTSKPVRGQQPCRAGASGHTRNTHLHGVRGIELHFGEVPGRILWTAGFPELLIKAGHVPSINGEDVVIALLELVIKRQAARHGGRGHRRDELRHLLEVLDVNRVHVHVVAWKPHRENSMRQAGDFQMKWRDLGIYFGLLSRECGRDEANKLQVREVWPWAGECCTRERNTWSGLCSAESKVGTILFHSLAFDWSAHTDRKVRCSIGKALEFSQAEHNCGKKQNVTSEASLLQAFSEWIRLLRTY